MLRSRRGPARAWHQCPVVMRMLRGKRGAWRQDLVLGARLWKWCFDPCFPPVSAGRALPLRLRCEFQLIWRCLGAVMQVQHLLFSSYYLGSALHAGVRAVVAFLVHSMGGTPNPHHHLDPASPSFPSSTPLPPPAAHQPRPPPRASSLHPVPTISHPAPCLVPSAYVGLRGCQLLPDVLLALGAGRRFLLLVCAPLARVYACSPPKLRGLRVASLEQWGAWDGAGSLTARPMPLHNVTCPCPSIERVARACRDSRSRHAGLYRRLSSLCLDREGTSHAKTCPPQAAAWSRRWQQLTPIVFGPLWHPGSSSRSFACSQTCPFQKLLSGRCWGG